MLATVLLLLNLGAADEALQRVAIPGESARTAQRLFAVDALLKARQWPEAIQELQRLVEDHGDDLVPDWVAAKEGQQLQRRRCWQARWLCHQRLAALPSEALALYRRRIEVQAQNWLEQGRRDREAALLQRLVEQAFCSRAAEEALDLLGDLAFERGAFSEAERWWRYLAEPASAGPAPAPELVFPDPRKDVALIRAKQLLARVFQAEKTELAEALAAFRKRHEAAKGHLAGRGGNLLAILESELARPGTASQHAAQSWSTFGGNSARTGVAPQPSRSLHLLTRTGNPVRRWQLDTGESLPETASTPPSRFRLPAQVLPRTLESHLLAVHPVVAGDLAFIADARSVTALDLAGGETLRYTLPGTAAERGPETPDTDFTLTFSDDRIYARLGRRTLQGADGPRVPALRLPALGTKIEPEESVLVCLEADAAGHRLRECWLVQAGRNGSAPAVFEGAPVVHEDRLWIALTHINGARARTAIACHDAATGKLLWQQDVCETDEFQQGQRRSRHHLLTAAGGRLFYCSHAGAVVALDAASGRRLWAVRYPSRGPRTREGRPSPRGLAPCLYARGRLFVAPADLEHVLCLNADTGQVLWESSPLEVQHLLGIAGDRLLVTAATPYTSIQALEVRTGLTLRGLLYPEEDAGLISWGRGLLAGNLLLWPTSAGLQVLDQGSLRPRADLVLGSNAVRGNLVLTPNRLLVAGRRVLSLYQLAR